MQIEMNVSQTKQLSSAYVLGVRVDRVTQQQVLDRVDSLIADYHASQQQTACQQLVTVNPEFVMAAQRNPIFCQCINEAALVMPDGIGVVWGCTSFWQACARTCDWRRYAS